MPEKITNSLKKTQETQPTVSKPDGLSQSKPKKLLDQVSEALRTKHYAYRTEQTYVDWIKRYILFHKKRHPEAMLVIANMSGVTQIMAKILYGSGLRLTPALVP